MAFNYEIVTPEQWEEFESQKIKIPLFYNGQIVREADMIAPFQWVIDKERNMYLLDTSVDRFYLDEFVFLFIWNHKNYFVQFNWVEDRNSVVWNLPKKYLIDDVFPYCTEEHFLDDLREALLVYGKMRCEHSKQEIRVRCNF